MGILKETVRGLLPSCVGEKSRERRSSDETYPFSWVQVFRHLQIAILAMLRRRGAVRQTGGNYLFIFPPLHVITAPIIRQKKPVEFEPRRGCSEHWTATDVSVCAE